MDEKHAILFVCHGNICRSVSAQYIMQDMVNAAGLASEFLIDSAATTTEEIGCPIYPPMRRALGKKGVPIGDHVARLIRKADYDKYDLIVVMDDENRRHLRRILGNDPEGKIHYLMEYTGRPDEEIDDPWYTRDFLGCANQIERGCRGLLARFAGTGSAITA